MQGVLFSFSIFYGTLAFLWHSVFSLCPPFQSVLFSVFFFFFFLVLEAVVGQKLMKKVKPIIRCSIRQVNKKRLLGDISETKLSEIVNIFLCF